MSDYSAGWPDLESIPGELKKLQQALKRQGFKVTRVMNPDSRKLKRSFEDFIDEHGYDRENRLLFYFSGHGYTRKVGGRQKGYLVPADAPNPLKDERGFLRRSLDMGQIQTWARQIEAKHALFLFDSCFSGTIFKSKALPVPRHITDKTARPVRQFITAGSAGEEVPARSVFLPSFIRAIEGEGDINGDGYVTGTELGQFLHEKVLGYDTGQTPQYGKIRDPALDEGDFVFPLAAVSAPVAAKLPKAPSKSAFSLKDIAGAVKKQKASRKAWGKKLAEMKAAHGKVQALDRDKITPDLKLAAWRRFLTAFSEDNPYSREDEALRKAARSRAAHWQGERQRLAKLERQRNTPALHRPAAPSGPVHTWERTFGGRSVDAARAVLPAREGGFLLVGHTSSEGAGKNDGWAIRLDGRGNKLGERTFGGNYDDLFNAAVAAPEGGFLLVGYTESRGVGKSDGWAIRLDGRGNKLWERTFGGKKYDVFAAAVAAPEGGFLLVGYSRSEGAGKADAWAIRLDEKGGRLWKRTFGGSSWDEANAVAATADGGFLLAGGASSMGAGKSDGWAIRLDGKGRKLWERAFGGIYGDVFEAAVATKEGGFLLAGYSSSKGAGITEAWAIRLDGQGNKLWERTFGGSGADRAIAVATTADGGFLLAGTKILLGRVHDAMVIRLDWKGRKLWERTFGGSKWDSAEGVVSTADGGFILAGSTGSKGVGRTDLWALKLDGEGRLR